MRSPLIKLAAINGAAAVALGAFGAHALKEMLATHGSTSTWQTASLYHLVHSPVLLIIALLPSTPKVTFLLFLSGIALFSGSLYLLSITQLKPLGIVTPIGGLLLIIAWLSLAMNRKSSP